MEDNKFIRALQYLYEKSEKGCTQQELKEASGIHDGDINYMYSRSV